MSRASHTAGDISLVFSGEAGQGLQTLEQLVTRLFKRAGYHVFSYSEVMSRIRGGNNTTQLRISSRRVACCLRRIDILLPLHAGAMARLRDRITPETVILGDPAFIDAPYLEGSQPVVEVPLAEMAREAGGDIYLNVLLAGLLSGLFCLDEALLEDLIGEFFGKAGGDRAGRNLEAARKGYGRGSHVLRAGQVLPFPERSEEAKRELLLTGVDAVGIGGLVGGCSFVSSYPMSPSTGLLLFYARHAQEFGLVVEQAEDEISAINMALGAWYAGGKALVTTSGGGFSLMAEGLSLAGSIESPVVIHLGQRPGPATGLPTRTEQADLEHALYSGHGEFPRLILAPGTLKEGYDLARHAFYMADRFQIPVFILTDQYFLEGLGTVDSLDIPPREQESFIVETDAGYRRYRLTEDGVSPRGIPGFGSGLVCVDSDEHDETGHITEDSRVRTGMVDKRLRKIESVKQACIPPTLMGSEDFRHLVVGWGSTFAVVREALDVLNRTDLAFLHFSQVYPLHPAAAGIMRRAEKRIILENNATAQFGKLIGQQTGIGFEGRVLKYDGFPFLLEEVVERLEALL